METLFGKGPKEIQKDNNEIIQNSSMLDKLDSVNRGRFSRIESVVKSADYGAIIGMPTHNSIMGATITSKEHISAADGSSIVITLSDKVDPAHEDLIEIGIDIDGDNKKDDFIIKINQSQGQSMFIVERSYRNPGEDTTHWRKINGIELEKFLTAVEKHLNIAAVEKYPNVVA